MNDLEYILNFNENKLFNTSLDDKYTNKQEERNYIKQAKEKYYKNKKERENMYDISRAFKFLKIHHTNTPHQALGILIEGVLKYSDYEWLVKYTADELRKIEKQQNFKDSKDKER